MSWVELKKLYFKLFTNLIGKLNQQKFVRSILDKRTLIISW